MADKKLVAMFTHMGDVISQIEVDVIPGVNDYVDLASGDTYRVVRRTFTPLSEAATDVILDLL